MKLASGLGCSARALSSLIAALAMACFSAAAGIAQTIDAPVAQVATRTQPAADNGRVVEGEIAATQTSTRFVILLEKDSEIQVHSLTNPNRVIIDLNAVNMSLPSIREPVGLVKAARGGLAGPGKARVVIDVTEPVVVEKPVISKLADGKGRRVVLDMSPASALALSVSAQKAAQSSGKTLPLPAGVRVADLQPPVPTPAVRPQLRAKDNHKDVIVIDPGHGGYDSGAVKNGTVEKDVVLAFSLALRDRLVATGRYTVYMTRDTDVFVPLDDRRAFAEKHNAALFIAVHADEAQPRARGATIYSLRDSVAEQLKRSAKAESGVNLLSEGELARADRSEDANVVKQMLSDLASRDVESTKKRASTFSQEVIEYMGADTALHDEPDRTAAFRVLKTAKVPAVLIELAYVSNEQDAKLLKSDQWRAKVSTSIVSAVDNYFASPLARLPM